MEASIRLLLIGYSGVGKSSLLNRFSDDEFITHHSATIGVDFRSKKINIGDKIVYIEIWDSTGNKTFRDIVRIFYKRINGVILLFDLSNKTSLRNINMLIDEINNFSNKNTFKILVGNKLDLDKNIDDKFVSSIIQKTNFDYIEISVKENINISELFMHIIDSITIIEENIDKESNIPKNKKKCWRRFLSYFFRF